MFYYSLTKLMNFVIKKNGWGKSTMGDLSYQQGHIILEKGAVPNQTISVTDMIALIVASSSEQASSRPLL